MIRNNIRGGYRMIDLTEKLGFFNSVVRYDLSDEITIDVPLYRAANRWDRKNVIDYDVPTVSSFANAINALPEPAIFVDCGADIGVMSVLVALQSSNIERYIGIEPNAEAYEILQQNYNRLPVKTETIFSAVSNFTGFGELVSPDYHPDDDHAKYLVQTENGEIPVIKIDDLKIESGKYIALKLDVEGAELDALEGAINTLSNAKGFVVDVEAHPMVASRTGIDPIDVLRRLNEIKPCQFTICERPGVILNLDKAFFEQVETFNHDVIAVSQ
jgi:FkbM family methyltransferase